MKKILPMIFLLTFSLSSFAALVTLKCDIDGVTNDPEDDYAHKPKKTEESWSFDQSKGIVMFGNYDYSVNTKCASGTDCSEAFINDRAFGMKMFSKNKTERSSNATISRIDGSYSYQSAYTGTYAGYSLNFNKTGKCAPVQFKQAF